MCLHFQYLVFRLNLLDAYKLFQVLLGKVVGLLWNHEFGNPEPPFGGSMAEYLELFSVHFKVDILDLAYNSIKPRSGRELFIKLIKK